VKFTVNRFDRVDEGKVAETWFQEFDMSAIFRQLTGTD
jgi:predicted ester cyclase